MAKDKQHDIPKMEADDSRKSPSGEIQGEGVQHPAQSTMENKNESTRKHSADPHMTASRTPPVKEETSSESSSIPSHLSTPDVSNVGYDRTLLSAAHCAGAQTEAVSDELQQQSPSAPPNSQARDQNEDAETNHASPTTDAESMLSYSPASRIRRSNRARTRAGRKRLEREIENFLEDAPVRTRVPSVPALDFDDDYGRVRMTRNAKKNIQLLTENKPLSPPPDMNLKRLTYKQFSDVRDRKVFDNIGAPSLKLDGNDEEGDTTDSEQPYQPRVRRSRDNGNTIDNLDSNSKNDPQPSRLMRGSKLRAIQSIRNLTADSLQTTGSRTVESAMRSATSYQVSTQERRSRSYSSDRSGGTTHDEVHRLNSLGSAPPSDVPQSRIPQHGDMLSSTHRTAASAAEPTENIIPGTDAPHVEDDNDLISQDNATQPSTPASEENACHQPEAERITGAFERTASQATHLSPTDQSMGGEQEQPQRSRVSKQRSATPIERPQKKIRLPPTV